MTILVVGASGATGRLLVQHLLDRGQDVKIIVRFPEKLPETLKHHDHLSVIQASISDIGDAEMIQCVKGCAAVASCLGHNLSLKGTFDPPGAVPFSVSLAYTGGGAGKEFTYYSGNNALSASVQVRFEF